MFTVFSPDREREISYARKWAYARNPAYMSFDELGGDCTNFVSQCLYAGKAPMNYTKDTGWYYISPDDRAAAWTGARFLYRFLMTNRSVGPFAQEWELHRLLPGDIVMLSDSGVVYHSLLVVANRYGRIYVAAHTFDAYDRAVESYGHTDLVPLHIMCRSQIKRY